MDPVDDPFARDRERIISSQAFRRLAGKTQVVAAPADPLVRTRLTHTLEVSSVAREIAGGLGLRVALVDAIALGHDIGHPAFGHAGERALAALVPGGFHHAAHGVRVVTELEPDLKLSPEVVDGILKHSKGRSGAVFARGPALRALTREALVVRAADLYAYGFHDLDDAYLLGTLAPTDVPRGVAAVLGRQPCDVRRALIERTVRASLLTGEVTLDEEGEAALNALREFLYARLYDGPRIARQTAFVRDCFATLWHLAQEEPRRFGKAVATIDGRAVFAAEHAAGSFIDVLAGMTDRQVLRLSRVLRLPKRAFSVERRTPRHRVG